MYTQEQLAILGREITVTEEDIRGMREDQLFKYVLERMGRELGYYITDSIGSIPVDFSFSEDFSQMGLTRSFKLELIAIDRRVLDELMHCKKMYDKIKGDY